MSEEKILVIQTAFPGDAILTLPMIQKLKEVNPLSQIDVIAIPSTSEIFLSSPSVNNVYTLEKRGKHKSIKSLLSFVKELKKYGYNKIYSPHRSFRTAIIVLFLGIRESYGFSNSSFKHVYKKIIQYRPDFHEVRRNLELIGFATDDFNWKILPETKISEDSKKKVDVFFVNLDSNKNNLVIAPGSVWNTKKYPEEHFRTIIEYFAEKSYTIILLGGKNDEEICNNLATGFSENVISVAGNFSFLESIEVLKNSSLLVSNDSAPTHLGMCADIPVLTLYCSTVAEFGFYPYNDKSEFLSYDELSCKPCGIHGYEECPIKTFECGNNLVPQKVIDKIEEMLNDKH